MYARDPFPIPLLYYLRASRPNYIYSTSNDINTDGARARAKTGGYKGIGRQEIQGKRRIPNGDKLSLYTPEY